MGGVVINEVEAEPLSEYAIDFLMNRKNETPYLDFKLTIDIKKESDFPEIAKDIFAFSNYGGGWILIGWKEEKKNQFTPIGLFEDYSVDQATLQEKFNSFVDEPLELLYKEIRKVVNGQERRFGFIFIPPSHKILIPNKEGRYKKGDKERIVFRRGDIFYRRGTQSIQPSAQENEILKRRIEKEKYRMSILSGEPDEIEEEIYSNLFEVKIPKYVYFGSKKLYDDISINTLLKQEGVFPEFYYKFKEWNNKILTFENLYDEKNSYSKLVDNTQISRESVDVWLADQDKSNLIIELLYRELIHFAISKKIYYSEKRDKLYYPIGKEKDKRKEQWGGRYTKSTRTVVAKMWAGQLGKSVYCHTACYASFKRIGSKIFLEVLPTFILTDDGSRPISGFEEGTVITRLSYNKYNNSYLNTILFWIHQLGDGKNIKITDYIEIESEPVKARMSVGILFDIPSSEFRLEIEDTGDEELFKGEDGTGI